MRKFFGTDGIRGKANEYPMTAEMCLKLGRAAAVVLGKSSQNKLKILIGKDTRKSGYVFEYALTAGLCSAGCDVYLVGPMPTPAIAHLIKSFAADFGIMITASHNPAEDNGIKFFDGEGYKLPDDVEAEIESEMEHDYESQNESQNESRNESHKSCSDVGKAHRIDDASGRYIEFSKNSIKNMSLKGLKIVLDCANGAAYKVSPLIFRELGAEVIVLNDKPDGDNINDYCGSQYPEVISTAVKETNANIGIALDGDADRVIMVDENGALVDGDTLIAMCAIDMKRRNKLLKNTVVVTVMANIGFHEAMKQNDINVETTKVGDRYIIENMRNNGYALGGEQSGHIIFASRATTGDGTLAALQVLALMKTSGKPLSELAQCMTTYPQILVNVKVKEKVPIDTLSSVQEKIKSAESTLGDSGRVLIRYSGTEKKCRVMLEGKDEDLIKKLAEDIADAIRLEIGE